MAANTKNNGSVEKVQKDLSIVLDRITTPDKDTVRIARALVRNDYATTANQKFSAQGALNAALVPFSVAGQEERFEKADAHTEATAQNVRNLLKNRIRNRG